MHLLFNEPTTPWDTWIHHHQSIWVLEKQSGQGALGPFRNSLYSWHLNAASPISEPTLHLYSILLPNTNSLDHKLVYKCRVLLIFLLLIFLSVPSSHGRCPLLSPGLDNLICEWNIRTPESSHWKGSLMFLTFTSLPTAVIHSTHAYHWLTTPV